MTALWLLGLTVGTATCSHFGLVVGDCHHGAGFINEVDTFVGLEAIRHITV